MELLGAMSYMTIGDRAGKATLAMRQDEVRRAVGLYRDLAEGGPSRVVFLAGERASGRTATLDGIAAALREARPRPALLYARFVSGMFVPARPGETRGTNAERLTNLASVSGSSGLAAVGAATGSPGLALAGIAAQILGASVATWVGARADRARADGTAAVPAGGPYAFEEWLRGEAARHPVVCLVDDADQAMGAVWTDIVSRLARQIDEGLPVLLLMTIEKPSGLGDEPDAIALAGDLVRRGLAEWWPMRPRTEEEVAAWLGPAEPDVARRLHAATGGNPRWVEALWTEWVEMEAVGREGPNRPWRLLFGRDEESLDLVDRILDSRLTRLLGSGETGEIAADARRILATAALEGPRFTADALARALGWDRDDLIDFLDDTLLRTDERPAGVLSEAGWAGPASALPMYAFSSDLHWHALRRYGHAEQERVADCRKLADALVEVYGSEVQEVAPTVARLYVHGERQDAARRYRRMADFGAPEEVLRWQAAELLALSRDDWDYWRYERETARLLEAAWELALRIPLRELLAIYEGAFEMARTRRDRVESLLGRGRTHVFLGEFGRARPLLEQARDDLARFGDPFGEADAWFLLAEIDIRSSGDRDGTASAKLATALRLFQQVRNVSGEVAVLMSQAELDRLANEFETGERRLLRALQLAQDKAARDMREPVLNGLIRVLLHLGKTAEARVRAQQLLALSAESGRLDAEASAWFDLARIDGEVGLSAAALAGYRRALALRQQLDERQEEAGVFYQLYLLARDSGHPAEGLRLLAQAFLVMPTNHPIFAPFRDELEEEAARFGYVESGLQGLLREIGEGYRHDRGWGLVEALSNALAVGDPVQSAGAADERRTHDS